MSRAASRYPGWMFTPDIGSTATRGWVAARALDGSASALSDREARRAARSLVMPGGAFLMGNIRGQTGSNGGAIGQGPVFLELRAPAADQHLTLLSGFGPGRQALRAVAIRQMRRGSANVSGSDAYLLRAAARRDARGALRLRRRSGGHGYTAARDHAR